MCEGESTRPSDDAMFFRTEIIDALKRSDEKVETYWKIADEKMDKLDEKNRKLLEENRRKDG